jgi:teichoic acid transport system ATP-binding protein
MAVNEPSVVAHDVHVTYRTYGGRRNALTGHEPNRLNRLLGRATKHVGAVNEIEAVRGVSFVAHEGESIGILGRNGSGKSTLLRAVAGLVPITSGAVYARGEIALLGVNAALVSNLTGERNIMLGGLAQGLSRKQVRERYDDIVDFADIGDFVHLPMRTYSSGMGARLRFAISSATAPDILIIDEALATGDAEFRERSIERVAQVRQEAGTVFVVSHSTATVRKMCNRAIWLEQGVVRAEGDAIEVSDLYREFIFDLQAQRRRRSA